MWHLTTITIPIIRVALRIIKTDTDTEIAMKLIIV